MTEHEKKAGSLVRAALVRAQAEMKTAKKDSTNPHFGSAYADLASVTDAARGPFAKHGLGWRHEVWSNDAGVFVRCIIFHESGEEILPEHPLFLPVPKKDAQNYKSGVTYGKRTTLEAAAGVSTDEDDDGNAASAHKSAPPRAAPAHEVVNEETGEVTEDDGAHYGPRIDWGRDEGKFASELDKRSLSFHIQGARKALADPSKEKWRAQNQKKLEELLAVAVKKGWASKVEAVQ
jgi:hypothetical protein